MIKKIFIFFLLNLLSLLPGKLYAQTCGFGCLGLSGAFAGYSFYQIDAPGLNDAVNQLMGGRFPSQEFKLNSIGGFRFGANIFRAKFDNYFISAKGYFQMLKDNQEYSASVQSGLIKDTYDFSMHNWGIGLDFGIPVFSFLDLKLIEGGINFYTINFKNESFLNGVRESKSEYENNQTEIGYYAATGFIIHIIQDYLSLESTASYNFFSLTEINYGKEQKYPATSNSKSLVDKTGFAATVQLNIGVPL